MGRTLWPTMNSAWMMIVILSSISVATDLPKEPLQRPEVPPDVFDGNHPDNHQITTHDHVDKALPHVPPTKRVKKILPPFESNLRALRHIDHSPPQPLPAADTPLNSTHQPPTDDDIHGIRLVPEEDHEGPPMQRTIWDLLRERERFDVESGHVDVVERNESESESAGESEGGGRGRGREKWPYEHFDAESAEVEVEMRGLRGEEEGEEGEGEGMKGREREEGKVGRKWYLLVLKGNCTIVGLRREDFTKYLKLNLAARVSVEYDDVRVNQVMLAPPKVIVNISVFAPSDDVAEESELDLKVSEKGEALLNKLAETNATLLELSGEEYRVIRFLSFESQRPEAEAHKDVGTTLPAPSRQTDIEFIAYTFLGSACACAALLTLFVTLNRYYKRVSDFACFKPKQMAWKVDQDADHDKDEFNGVSPAVIYSGGFPQIRGSWMTGPAGQTAPPVRTPFPPAANPRQPRPPYPLMEDRPLASPRHSRLHIYNCDANSLVIPLPLRSRTPAKGGDTHPLDVRLPGEEGGQDNPIFSN